MTKKLLVDLSILRHPYCGLGQIAGNYARWYAAHAHELRMFDITLLVPRNHMGAFGNDVKYLPALDLYRHLPWLMPHYDIWHSIHQLSPFRPADTRTRRVLTIHDLNFLHEKTPAKQKRYLRRLQKECDHAADICFISHFAQNEALANLQLEGKNARVIYNGVENLTQGRQQKPAGIDEGERFLLNIGVVKAKKNQHTLMETMRLLPELTLVIAGNDSDPYAQQLRTQLPQNVKMLGIVSDEERRWLYAHCQGLVFPSTCEGFGLPAIEAMQWGKPVFLSTLTSLPEIGGNHAFYFSDFEAQHMADTIANGLAQFSAKDAEEEQTYATSFNYSKHMEQYIELFQEMAKC